ncbi:hypothetical protein ACNPQM_36440 [Streptomyces sp. NPDC056231]|uniref:hypothetical protein n=1 Tax=unclassified Streptomyces TaxID=2593676 RepID=UPI0033CED521
MTSRPRAGFLSNGEGFGPFVDLLGEDGGDQAKGGGVPAAIRTAVADLMPEHAPADREDAPAPELPVGLMLHTTRTAT